MTTLNCVINCSAGFTYGVILCFCVVCFLLLFSAKFRAVHYQTTLSDRRLWIQLQRKVKRTSYSEIIRPSFVVTFPFKDKTKKEPCKRDFLPPGELLGSSRKTSVLTDVIRSFELRFISLRFFASPSFELPCLLHSLAPSHIRFNHLKQEFYI
jgi:hypothetical protein